MRISRYILFLVYFLALGCDKENETVSPSIISFTPDGGRPGTKVTLVGRNFGNNPQVFINQTPVSVIVEATTELIVFEVPVEATNGAIKVFNGSASGLSPRSFSVYQPPVIESFSPATGVANSLVTILGKNFTTGTSINFGDNTTAFVYEVTPTSLKAYVPVDAIPGKIQVVTMGGMATSASDFIANPPLIKSLKSDFTSFPVSVSGPGHRIIIEGIGFHKTGSQNLVQFNGIIAQQLHNVVTNELLIVVPKGSTTGKISVTVGGYTTTYDQIITIPKGEWKRSVDFPGEKRVNAQVFVIGNDAYYGTGINPSKGTYLKDFWKFDSDTNTWSPIPDLPANGRFGAIAFSLNGRGYVGGGAVSNDFWEYDPTTNTWERKADLPPLSLNRSFSVNGKGYAFGQYDCQMWEYDPQQNTWTRKADYPGACFQFGACFAMVDKIYFGAASEQYQFSEYDPLTNSWTQKSNLPGNPRMAPLSFSTNGYGYCGAGQSFGQPMGTGFEEDVWKYDPQLNEWTPSVPFIGVSRSSWNLTFTIGDKAYVLDGGTNTIGNYMFEFTP